MKKSLEFADIRSVLFAPLFYCKSAAPIPKCEASHMAMNGGSGSGIIFDICSMKRVFI